MDSALDLQTLLPAAGAVLFTIGDWDEEVSDWATGENPLFSSERTAKDFSDWGVGALGVEFVATALMTPSADSETGDWKLSKFKGFLVEGASAAATWGVTEGLKNVVQRTRPDREDTKSFPSGHTSGAFSFATLANRNLNSVRLPNEARLPLQIANLVTATAVGWARVEGDKHFPSDVLAGAALGHFVTAFIHDAFLGLPEDKRFGFTLYRLDTEGVVFGISADF